MGKRCYPTNSSTKINDLKLEDENAMNLSEYLLIFKSSLALDENAMNGGLFARKSTRYKLTMIKG